MTIVSQASQIVFFRATLISYTFKIYCVLVALIPLWAFGSDLGEPSGWRESGPHESALEVYVNLEPRAEDAREINNNKAKDARRHRRNIPHSEGSGARGVGFKWHVDKEPQEPVIFPQNGYSPGAFGGWGYDPESTLE